jgi:hypothetical protein
MLPRILTFGGIAMWLDLSIRVLRIGMRSGQHFVGWRRQLVKLLGQIAARLSLLCGSHLRVDRRDDEIDYKEWLGPGYEKQKPNYKPPIIISTHRAWSVWRLLTQFRTSSF